MAAGGGGQGTAQRILRITDIADEPLGFLAPIGGYAKMPLVSLEKAIEPLVSILPDVQSYVYVAKQKCTKPVDTLTQDESAAIMLYTMGWEPLDECLYVVLNNILRSPDRKETLKPWYLYLRLFLNALFRLPPCQKTTYRGVKLDISNRYIKGKPVVWWGFSSSTLTLDVLKSDLFLGKTGPRTIFSIQCESARDIRNHSYYPVEDELLLLAATQFEVISSLDQGDLRIIQLKETRPPHPLLQPVPIVVSQPNHPVSTTTNSPSVPQPVPITTVLSSSVPQPPKNIILPKPMYRNDELERLIAKEKTSTKLDLFRNRLTGQDAQIVAYYALYIHKALNSLDLGYNKIGAEGAKHLSDALLHNTTLTSLNLWDNEIGAEGAKHLSDALLDNTTLTSLDLRDNHIGAEGVKHLRDALLHNTGLISLDLQDNKIGAKEVKHLSDALLHNRTLTSLNLWDNEIGAEGAKHLSDALLHNTTLTSLNLAVNKIGAEGAKHLSDALLHNTTLTSLDLHCNEIGDRGAKHLSDALLHNAILISLNLYLNKIGAEGAKHLSDALLHNRTLISLDLTCNEIGAEGAKHLSDALLHNTTLTSLNLAVNKIGAEGAKHLSDALLHNTTLTSLDLHCNEIGDRGAKHLSDALLHNATLTSLNLEANLMGAEGAKHLIGLKKINRILQIKRDKNSSIFEETCVIS